MSIFVHRKIGHFACQESEEGLDLGGHDLGLGDQVVDVASEVVTDEPQEEEGEVVITIGDEAAPVEEETAAAPEWVKELRKNHREAQRTIRELQDKLKSTTSSEPAQIVLGPKPDIDSCGFDGERLVNELDAWHERKRLIEEQQAKANAAVEEANKAWQSKLDNYNQAKASLRVRDFAEAEDVVREALSPLQQSAIVKLSKRPELVIYALGSRPGKAKELAAIKDPAEYIYALAQLEKDLKVSNGRTPPPPPERTPARGNASISSTVDSTLERLRAEAEKTGDLSKVMEYKRNKRA